MEMRVKADPRGVHPSTATAKLNVAGQLARLHFGNAAMLDQSVDLAEDAHSSLARVHGHHHFNFRTANACECVATAVLGQCRAREQSGGLTPTAAAEALLGCVEDIAESVATGSPGAPENAQRELVTPVRTREITADLAAMLSSYVNAAPRGNPVPSSFANHGYDPGASNVRNDIHRDSSPCDFARRSFAAGRETSRGGRAVPRMPPAQIGSRGSGGLFTLECVESCRDPTQGEFLLSDSGDRAPESDQREGVELLRQTARDWGRLAAQQTWPTVQQRSAARGQKACVEHLQMLLELNGHCPEWPECDVCLWLLRPSGSALQLPARAATTVADASKRRGALTALATRKTTRVITTQGTPMKGIGSI